jgi:heme/copper-type cytochrome/quinol oxidase subunit 3
MLLFIVSELMFFFAFFWAFFHSSFNPSHAIGGVWPPVFLTVLDPWSIPLLNTVYLLTSGAFVTCAHNAIIYGSSLGFKSSMYLTLFFAINFIFLQALEYYSISFSLSDTVYASVFFMLTGFHGFHVLIGTLFLMVSNFRIKLQHYSREHHFGFEAAAWYWHFVDVIWLLLFVIVYWWGS